MSTQRKPNLAFRPSLPFVLFLAFLGALWFAGGASRADVYGQQIIRSVSAIILVVLILTAARPAIGSARPVLWLLLASFVLALLQLIPLPPNIWQALPGRSMFSEAAAASGAVQPWRPWSIVPGGTVNAAVSLIVPATAFLLVLSLSPAERMWLPGLMLAVIAAAMLMGLLQLSGSALDNPLLNDSPGQVSGSFANRNHLALFLAIGCLLAPVWAFLGGRRPQWRGPVALGLVVLLPLTILATGSRAGMLLGVLALALGLILTIRDIRRTLRHYPRWVLPVVVGGILVVVVGLVLTTVVAGRALSIDRAIASDPGQDMRARGLPIVMGMIRDYFPAGAGLGGFDPLFRLHEPFGLLKLTYFNHAHNDWLEIVLDAGLPGLLLLAAAVLWWAWASVSAWRAVAHDPLPSAGSAVLFLVFIASLFDYPARTPMMMAMMVVAALWLSRTAALNNGPALPKSDQHL